jgi:hypothetical protein
MRAIRPSILGILLLVPILTTQTLCSSPGEIGTYSPGGRNIEAYTYSHEEGFPPFPDRVSFVGELRGDWHEMGRQFGDRAGESTRYVSDIWWRDICESFGKEETLKAFELYTAQIAALDPGLIDFMRGLAEGAARWLDESPFADADHPLHATNYERVLAVNLYDEWAMMHPRSFPDGSSTYGGAAGAPEQCPVAGCSAFAARGAATLSGETLSGQNRHSPYSPRCYEQAYVLVPDSGHAVWVLTNSPQVAANQVVNDAGVSLSLLAGGFTTPLALDYEGETYCAEGFGVAWFHLFLYAAVHADNAREAIEILTLGTEEYRDRTGRKTLLRGGGWNFLVADGKTLAVVEATADRYAVRYAGDRLPFTGPDWTDDTYIVATNHFICDFSYGPDNRRTNVPMTIFREGYDRDPESGEITGLNESGVRFWTLMWDVRHNYGHIDRYRAQQIMSGAYAHDQETGERIEVVETDSGAWAIYGTEKFCTAGILASWGGTCDSKIAVIKGDNVSVGWTMGSPVHWQGAWDTYQFSVPVAR